MREFSPSTMIYSGGQPAHLSQLIKMPSAMFKITMVTNFLSSDKT